MSVLKALMTAMKMPTALTSLGASCACAVLATLVMELKTVQVRKLPYWHCQI